MKYLAPLLVLYGMVCFTAPDGFAVWVQKDQVVSVSRARECSVAAGAKLSTSNGTFLCVREGVAEAVRKLDAAK
jgi:hypothetical protein